MKLSRTRSGPTDEQQGLTEEQRERFERDGYLIVEDALDEDHVRRLVEAVDRAWMTRRQVSPSAAAEPLHLLAFVGSDRRFLELLDHPPVLELVTDLLGWNVFMYHCHLDVHPPEIGQGSGKWMWHQDGGVQNRDLETRPAPRMSVKVAYFLSDVSRAGRGNLVVVPGSHLRSPETDVETHVGGHELPGAVPILARPGTAVLFDRRLWHMRSENRSGITRKALFFAYTYRWVRPRDDHHVAPEILSEVTPIRAQLLGSGTGAIGHWMPTDDDVPLRDWWERRA